MPGIASSSPAVLLAHVARRHVDDPDRLGRRHAAEPRAARGRRAVRDARGAASRSRRPRHRPRARHRPGHGARRSAAPPTPLDRGRLPRAARASCSASSTAPSPTTTRTAASPRCRVSATGPRCGCSVRATTAPSSPAMLGLPFSFAHHFAAAQHRRRALAAYRDVVPAVRRRSTGPYVMLGVQSSAPTPTSGRRGSPAPSALAIVRLRRAARRATRRPEEAAAYPFTPLSARSRGAGRPARRRRPRHRPAPASTSSPSAPAPTSSMLTTMVHGPADRLAPTSSWPRPSASSRLPPRPPPARS